MGGFGSGRWQGSRPGARRRVEACTALRAADAARMAGVTPPGPTVVRVRPGDHPEALEAVACRFGGWRWWWRCSRCNVRRAALYHAGDRWGCRACLDLAYASSAESRRFDPLIARIAGGPWTRSLAHRLIFQIDRYTPHGVPIDRRGRRWGRKRRLRLILDAYDSGLVRLR